MSENLDVIEREGQVYIMFGCKDDDLLEIELKVEGEDD